LAQDLYAPDSSALATSFPNLRIISKLGEGGFKHAYEAIGDRGVVAFKLIKSHQDRERTLRELMAAARFSSPHFPRIFDYGEARVETDDVVFIVEEFIRGESLRARLNKGPLTETDAVRIGGELLDALGEVAAERLVHRDVKPENIMLAADGRVILLDFGIARHLSLTSLTQDAAMFGPLTPGYGAPEQIRNEKRAISPRTDTFAWGIVMYEMLAGQNPFTQGCATSSEAMARTLNYQPPKLAACSPDVAQAIDWCLQKSPHRRPMSPAAVKGMLTR